MQKAVDVSASVSIEKARVPSAAEPSDQSLGRLSESLPSWLVSLVGHLLVLTALWPLHIATSMIHDRLVSATVENGEEVVNPAQPDSFRFDTAVVSQIGNGGDHTNDAQERVASLGAAIETPTAPVLNVVGAVASLGTQQVAVKRPMLDMGVATRDRDLTDIVQSFGGSEHTGGVPGAIDRLTLEIEASLREENTLVIWLFDATPSMEERREAIASRFENIYHQLGLRGVGGNGALKTVVATFGRGLEYLTARPVDDISAVQKAIRKIKNVSDGDKGAVENVFGATLSAAEKYRGFRTRKKDRRRVMIVVVTDERGSDYLRVEEAISRLRKLEMRTYCVGDDAVFGREHHYFPHVFADGYHGLGFTNRGPETAMLEALQLGFWGAGGDGRLEEMTSGFPPYALCRLCKETGGLYLISDELPGPRFDDAIMRNYLPDYRPLREYQSQLAANAAKAGLVHAAMAATAEKIPRPQMQFRADNDNTLRQQITEAQKPLAELDYHLNQMHTLLEGGEKDRPLLDTPRWQVSYDLAMGRVLAMRARAYGYNLMLADMKTLPHPFQNPGSNTWRIVPASEEHAPPRLQKFAERARKFLESVVRDHRGTPWELLARQELQTPMSWEWRELHVEYPPPPPPRQPNVNPIQLEEERQQQMMRRQTQVSHDPVKL